MKGLLLKDLYNMGQQKKILVFLALFYGAFALFTDSSGMLNVFVLVCSMLSVSAFSYDEFAKWDSYALSLPVTRKEIVAARYLFATLLTGCGALAVLVLGTLSFIVRSQTNFGAMVISIASITALSFLLLSLLLPLCYKFGLEKGRIMLMIFMMVLVFLGMSLPEFLANLPEMFALQSLLLPVIVLLLCAVALVLSYSASVRIYEKKEF